ncbi:ABC transporter substrate-binding protein [Solicola sp. PLA-1-18]|uniref:ABC transporter substrate-binding protein n=1 Tax=Solicola sp. PLA-1-18 TaxID=3380532 RepID=UPI003B7B662C
MLAAGGLAACGGGDGGVPVVNLYGGAAAAGFDKIIADCNDQADGEYRIVGNLLPSDADGQREQLVRRLAAKDDGLDLIGMDVVWTAEFAEAGWIREIKGADKTAATEGTLAPTIATAEWKDKLYGVPKHTNVQLLWYRKSLVPTPPTTWDEMIDMAKQLKSEGKPYQIGFTGSQYEGYVVGFNTILSSYGGELVNANSTEATVDGKTVQALALIKKFATSGVASASLSNSQEPEVFAQMQQGKAAFILNWPYVLSAMRDAGSTDKQSQEVYDDLGYAPYPSVVAGETPKVTLGGMNYGISTYSKHPRETLDAAMCLRTPEHQLQTALEAGDPPVNEAVYSEPEFTKAYPQGQDMLTELQVASSRPISPLYQNISTIVSTTLSPPAQIQPDKTARELKSSIQDALEGKGILP